MTKNGKVSEQAIVTAAISLALEGGLDAVGIRAAGRLAGVSGSLVSYHFKGRDALVSAISEQITREHYEDLHRLLDRAASLAKHLRSPAGALAAACIHAGHTKRARTLLLLDLRLHRAAAGEGIEENLAQRFWGAFAEKLLGEGEEAWPWAMIADSVLWYVCLDQSATASATWVTKAFGRLEARLRSTYLPPRPAPATPAGHTSKRQEAESEQGASNRTRADEITDAVMRLLGRGEKITHRSVASEAQVPLASTTYLFPDKIAMLESAYDAIYEKSAKNLQAEVDSGVAISMEANGSISQSAFLYAKLLIHTCRSDTSDKDHAYFLSRKGEGSSEVLKKKYIHVDRMDGLLWSLFTNPFNPVIMNMPLEGRRTSFRDKLSALEGMLFAAVPAGD